ncbi:hypothetical protein Scep_021813 [Stephania cephalantha]|uniref:Uncharacterized protein n=1 Tax=Stephania cephalantha TaxID=152367 RepID=A0AAP0I255_9MAGN
MAGRRCGSSSGVGERQQLRRQRRWRGSGGGAAARGNGVEQRRGGALPDRSIPDETTTVDKAS